MAPVIRVDEQVMAKLREQAKAFNLVFEPPNSTLRVILGLDLPPAPLPEAAIQPRPLIRNSRRGEVIEWRKGRLAREYVREARDRYERKQIDAEEFIAEVWHGIGKSAERREEGQHVVERATKALLELLPESRRVPVRGAMILERAQIAHNQTSSFGMWPWLGAGVVRVEKDERGRRCYSIPEDDFYTAMLKVIPRP